MNEPFKTGLKPKTGFVVGGKPRLYNTPKLNNYAWFKKHVKNAVIDKTGTIEGIDYLLIDHISYYLANQLPSHIDIEATQPQQATPTLGDSSNEGGAVAIIAIVAFIMLGYLLGWLILS